MSGKKPVLLPPSGELLSRHTICWNCKNDGLKWGCHPVMIECVYSELGPQVNWSNDLIPPNGSKPSSGPLCEKSHNGAVSCVEKIPSSEYRWQPSNRVVFSTSEYVWKDPGRGQRSKAHLPIGSVKRSPQKCGCG